MNEEEFLLLKSIALSLERIADSLEKNAHNEVDDKVDVAVESSDDTNENENMDYGCSVKEIDVNILIDKLQEKNITVKTYVDSITETLHLTMLHILWETGTMTSEKFMKLSNVI